MPQKLEDGTEVYTAAEMKASEAGLKASQQTALDEAKTAKRIAGDLKSAWGDLDPVAVKALIAENKARNTKTAEGEGDWKALEDQLRGEMANMSTAHEAQVATMKAREMKLMDSVEKNLVTAQLTSAIAGHKGDADLLLPHARGMVKVRETDDGFEAYVADPAGNPRFSDGGKPMTFDELVSGSLIEAFPRAFDGAGGGGSGASKNAGGASGAGQIDTGDNQAFLNNLEGIAKGSVAVR